MRKADGRVVSPPLSLLCKEDQAFVSKWEESQQDNIFAGGVMEDDDSSSEKGSPAAAQGDRQLAGGLPVWSVGSEPLVLPPGNELVLQTMTRTAIDEGLFRRSRTDDHQCIE